MRAKRVLVRSIGILFVVFSIGLMVAQPHPVEAASIGSLWSSFTRFITSPFRSSADTNTQYYYLTADNTPAIFYTGATTHQSQPVSGTLYYNPQTQHYFPYGTLSTDGSTGYLVANNPPAASPTHSYTFNLGSGTGSAWETDTVRVTTQAPGTTNQRPVVTSLTSPSSATVSELPATMTFTATATDDVEVTQVNFYFSLNPNDTTGGTLLTHSTNVNGQTFQSDAYTTTNKPIASTFASLSDTTQLFIYAKAVDNTGQTSTNIQDHQVVYTKTGGSGGGGGGGGTVTNPTVTFTVTPNPVVTPAEPIVVSPGTSLVLKAEANDPDGLTIDTPIYRVKKPGQATFAVITKATDTSIHSGSLARSTLTYTDTSTPGIYTFTATAKDNVHASQVTTSPEIKVKVTGTSTTGPTIDIIHPIQNQLFNEGEQMDLEVETTNIPSSARVRYQYKKESGSNWTQAITATNGPSYKKKIDVPSAGQYYIQAIAETQATPSVVIKESAQYPFRVKASQLRIQIEDFEKVFPESSEVVVLVSAPNDLDTPNLKNLKFFYGKPDDLENSQGHVFASPNISGNEPLYDSKLKAWRAVWDASNFARTYGDESYKLIVTGTQDGSDIKAILEGIKIREEILVEDPIECSTVLPTRSWFSLDRRRMLVKTSEQC